MLSGPLDLKGLIVGNFLHTLYGSSLGVGSAAERKLFRKVRSFVTSSIGISLFIDWNIIMEYWISCVKLV